MAAIFNFKQDTDKLEIGTVVGVNTDDISGQVVTYYRRVDINDTDDIVKFCKEFKVVIDSRAVDLTNFNAIVQKIFSEFEKVK